MEEDPLSEGERRNRDRGPQKVIIQVSSNRSSSKGTSDSASATVALMACSLGLLLSLKDPADKNGVPIFFSGIFKGNVFAFGALVVSVLLAFSSSSGALFLFHTGGLKEARFFRSCSIFCLVTALAVLLYAVCSSPA